MRILKCIVILCLLCFCGGEAFAQDPQFSQFYAAPLYHNPAFTGSGYAPRVMFNYRNQWPSLDANFSSSAITLDNYVENINSGFGAMFVSDQISTNRLTNTRFSLFYAYQMSLSEDHFVRFGIQGTYGNRKFDLNGLTFPGQFGNGGFDPSLPTDPIVNAYNGKSFSRIDFTPGVLYYSPKAFLGVSAHHLAQSNDGSGERLAMNLMVNGGFNVPLANPYTNAANANKEFVLTPAFLFKTQGKFKQLDLGAYATYEPLTLGLWYRGIPFLTNGTKTVNQDALTALVGFRFDSFSFGYSYDVTISGLGVGSGGSHEISLSYQFNPYKNEKNPYLKKRRKALACPKF
ncbi:type IX secretion system membrane protein PorP/SprF [Marinilongibacter aquaticus]|uniref:PorP/SprF family type IX secretion system membrane protein n=1 Tax=Marinilongibacter aquaticus TaxID=2975157 RepID=UPI0021BD4D47|nr:type IX secretion system membrane protein PorP/SprF [Marinilongibacter aquaticus]UBM57657.1 type IX secretion system membrane protein PorP/SprF [Marinilongibacter aquaticus]